MKPSSFNVLIPLDDDETIIYNTFSDSRVIVNSELLKAIESCDQPVNRRSSIQEQLEQVVALGIIIDDGVNELKEIEYWAQRVKFDNESFNVTILTTLACNMKCVYCFEQGVSSLASMKKQTAEALCEWISGRLGEVRPKKLIITFFGGEPLLNVAILKYLSISLHEIAAKVRVDFGIELITNGLLLTEEIVHNLIKCGLEWIKVTLDGDEEIHDRMRPRKSGTDSGTYRDIMSNLLMLKGKIPFIIGSNYDSRVKKHLPSLYDDLKKNGFNKNDIKEIAFKPILGFPGYKEKSHHHIKACSFSETDVDVFPWLTNEVKKRGYKPYTRIRLGPCDAVRENSYTIDPSGYIYKCAAMAGRTELSLGNISDDSEKIFFSQQNIAFMTADPWKKCGRCKFIPICGGGCRLSALSTNDSISAVTCEKRYFERVSTALVKDEVLSLSSMEEG